MRRMGLEAIYPKPRLSNPAPGHRIYPYLLRGVKIDRPDQVWSSDITCIRLRGGFIDLVAIIRLVQPLRSVLGSLGNFGAQFSSDEFTGRLKDRGIKISMDGPGRALDNVFMERLWRSVKCEGVYVKDHSDVGNAIKNSRRTVIVTTIKGDINRW